MDSTVAYKYEGDGGIGITVGDLLKGPCRAGLPGAMRWHSWSVQRFPDL